MIKSSLKSTSIKHKTTANIYLTSQGLEQSRAELEQLKNVTRGEVAQRIQRAREYGDLSENSEYDAALAEQNMMENRIDQLEKILKDAQVIKMAPKSDFVVLGSTVKVQIDGETDEFTIVGRVEADPSKKLISNESPVGSALLGAKKGEVVEVTTPIVRYRCKILSIK